jgi:hypothetical protein
MLHRNTKRLGKIYDKTYSGKYSLERHQNSAHGKDDIAILDSEVENSDFGDDFSNIYPDKLSAIARKFISVISLDVTESGVEPLIEATAHLFLKNSNGNWIVRKADVSRNKLSIMMKGEEIDDIGGYKTAEFLRYPISIIGRKHYHISERKDDIIETLKVVRNAMAFRKECLKALLRILPKRFDQNTGNSRISGAKNANKLISFKIPDDFSQNISGKQSGSLLSTDEKIRECYDPPKDSNNLSIDDIKLPEIPTMKTPEQLLIEKDMEIEAQKRIILAERESHNKTTLKLRTKVEKLKMRRHHPDIGEGFCFYCHHNGENPASNRFKIGKTNDINEVLRQARRNAPYTLLNFVMYLSEENYGLIEDAMKTKFLEQRKPRSHEVVSAPLQDIITGAVSICNLINVKYRFAEQDVIDSYNKFIIADTSAGEEIDDCPI